MSLRVVTERRYPVVEIFGPTIQGEGALAGLPTMFVRFGGCDYRCSWCDSMYAVDPSEVRENSEKLTSGEIAERLLAQSGGTIDDARGLWVTFSGGNPALMRFEDPHHLPRALQAVGMRIAVETQGSIWRGWLGEVDHLTVSPKPPSSGMVSARHWEQTRAFLDNATAYVPRMNRSLKIVVFDDTDYVWARNAIQYAQRAAGGRDFEWQTFLSVGTDQDALQDEYRVHAGIAERYRWLCETVATDPLLRSTRVLPQLHVIAWGTRRGV